MIDQTIINYWKTHDKSENYESRFICECCHKPMADFSELENVACSKNSIFYIKGQNYKTKNGKEHLKLYQESVQNRFLFRGKNMSGKMFFRRLCWDCFHKKLEETIEELHKTRSIKYDWVRKWMKGQLKNYYPLQSQSACFYFKFLFGMTDEELKKECDKFVTASLEAHIKKYGDNDIARQKYEEYCKLQARNGCSLEYFVEKYGEEDGKKKYDEVCKAKAVTKKNCIEKYGIEYGKKLFNDYCKKQVYAGNKLEYFIEKYGEEEGKKKYDEVCHQKALTLVNFIRKYGEKQGKEEYEKYISSIGVGYSTISQKLFESIDTALGSFSNDAKWFLKNGEAEYEIDFLKSDGTTIKKFARPDYVLGNKIIEFNGDYWHMNPEFYSSDDSRYFIQDKKILAKELWDLDKRRQDGLEKLGFTIKIVWENDYRNNPEKVIEECCNFLKG